MDGNSTTSDDEPPTAEELAEERRARGVKLLPRKRKAATHRRSTRLAQPGRRRYTLTHAFAKQQQLAAEQTARLSDDLEVRPSAEHGYGLFAKTNLPQDYDIMYFGRYYPSNEAVLGAQLPDTRYVFGKATHYFDGLAIPDQFAIRANHRRRGNNATLAWFDSYGEIGQPLIRTVRPVGAGEEITVDYGSNYAYDEHGFQRGSGHSDEPDDRFYRLRRAICDAIGEGTTSTSDLNRLGSRLMGSDFFRGTFARGDEPAADGTRHCCIVNTSRLSDEDGGQHWVLLYREPGHDDLVFDSFGRGTMGFAGVGTDPDVNQQRSNDHCGQGAVAMGLLCQTHGRDYAQQI